MLVPVRRALVEGVTSLDTRIIPIDKSLKEMVHDSMIALLTIAACPACLRS
jgi:hypothetical protein